MPIANSGKANITARKAPIAAPVSRLVVCERAPAKTPIRKIAAASTAPTQKTAGMGARDYRTGRIPGTADHGGESLGWARETARLQRPAPRPRSGGAPGRDVE